MTRRAPGPRGHVLWGSLSGFRQDTLGLLERGLRDHGDMVRFRIGPVTAHLVNRVDLIDEILLRSAAGFDKDTRSADRIAATCGKSLLSADQQMWHRHRRLIQPVFQPRHLGGIEAVVDTQMEPLLTRWYQAARAGESVDVVSEMTELAIAVSARVMFGSVVDSARIEAALQILLNDSWRRIQALADPSMLSGLFHRPAFKAARATIDAIVFDIIGQRRSMGAAPDDLLSRLLQAHQDSSEAGLSDQELRDAAVTLLLAGHETTATALAWAVYLLGQHPEANPDIVGLDEFLAETLRLYPSIWIIERRAIMDQEIGGYQIPKGSSVLISPYLLHRNDAYWHQPLLFNPSRFGPAAVSKRPRHAYLPFGLGQHRCVGLHMAQSVARCVIHNINAAFHMQPIAGEQPLISARITLRHDRNFRMKPRLRASA